MTAKAAPWHRWPNGQPAAAASRPPKKTGFRGFRVLGLGLRVRGLGFLFARSLSEVWGFKFRFRTLGSMGKMSFRDHNLSKCQ